MSVSDVGASEAHSVLDVRLQNLTKRFDEVAAVDDLSLDIERGRFVALLGPSGCGKTTTLRMIGGFEEPTAGRIMLGDRDVAGQPAYKRDVNTVFQSYALFPHLSTFENVAFGLRRRGVKGDEVKRRALEALELVGLSGMAKRKARQMSGGQQQRVALARALVNRPRVLLLDEPLGALDLKLRKQMQLELKQIQREVGLTFIHVTHDQEEAMTMADQIVVMNHGKIEQAGTSEELYEHPRTAFVAGFLGVSNLLSATVSGEGQVRLSDGSIGLGAAPRTCRSQRRGLHRDPAGEDPRWQLRAEPDHRHRHRECLHGRLDPVHRRHGRGLGYRLRPECACGRDASCRRRSADAQLEP